MPDNDTARKVCLDYTLAAAKAISSTCRLSERRRFRFVYLSGREGSDEAVVVQTRLSSYQGK